MSSSVDPSAEPSRHDEPAATARPNCHPMSAAACEPLERTFASRLQDPEFHRKVEAVRRRLAEEIPPSQ